jgi:CBS-domain-containing membrane protein
MFFFGHLLTALVGVIFVNYIPLPIYINIALAVGAGVSLMILFNVVHPPAGGNPIIVIIGSVSYEYLISPIIFWLYHNFIISYFNKQIYSQKKLSIKIVYEFKI